MTLPIANWNLEHLSVYFLVILPLKRDIDVTVQKNENILSLWMLHFFKSTLLHQKLPLEGELR